MSYGSTDKLLQTIARNLAPDRFDVTFLYGDKPEDTSRIDSFAGSSVRLVPFSYDGRNVAPPHAIINMRPNIVDVIDRYGIDCVFLVFWSNYQFPLNVIPSTVSVVGVSPFGQWSSNGRVVRTYCSGPAGVANARLRGSRNAEIFFNPLEGPPPELREKPPVGRTVVFGRIGRPDDRIFDPIAVRAFDRLRREYGDAVRYEIVAPPPAMSRLVAELGTPGVAQCEPITDEKELWLFYNSIDVLAHARYDGETLGVAIGEAMLAGTPIVSHVSRFNNAHIELLLEPSFARWAAVDDVDAYYEHLRWFVEHPEQIRPMGARARLKAESLFGLREVMARVEADLLEAGRRSGYRTRRGRLLGKVLIRLVAANFALRYLSWSSLYRALGDPRTRRWRVLRRIARSIGITERQRLGRDRPRN